MKQLTILFLVKDDQVLLAMKKRGFGEGRWNGVGGKLELGETIEQAVIRECKEEIIVSPREFEKVAEIIFDEQHQGIREELQVHVFVCSKWQGEPAETEEMAPKWFPINQLPLKEMWNDDKYWLHRILKGEKLKCRFVMNDQDVVSDKSIKTVSEF